MAELTASLKKIEPMPSSCMLEVVCPEADPKPQRQSDGKKRHGILSRVLATSIPKIHIFCCSRRKVMVCAANRAESLTIFERFVQCKRIPTNGYTFDYCHQ